MIIYVPPESKVIALEDVSYSMYGGVLRKLNPVQLVRGTPYDSWWLDPDNHGLDQDIY